MSVGTYLAGLVCGIRGHEWGRWRRVPPGSVMYGLRVRKCKRCGYAEDSPASARKRPAKKSDADIELMTYAIDREI